MVICLIATGCSSNPLPGNGGEMVDAAKYVGTWRYSRGGTVAANCPGQQPAAFPLEGAELSVVAGAVAGQLLVSVSTPTDCVLKFNASGNAATLAGAQMCIEQSDQVRLKTTFHFSNGQLRVLDESGVIPTLTENVSGRVTTDQLGESCSYSRMGSATRVDQ
jgi:hypothetical protein